MVRDGAIGPARWFQQIVSFFLPHTVHAQQGVKRSVMVSAKQLLTHSSRTQLIT